PMSRGHDMVAMFGNLFKKMLRRLGRGIIDANQWGPGLPDHPSSDQDDLGMTEAEWLESETPKPMLRHLLGTDQPRVQDIEAFPDCKGSDRKMRLFACACYRRISHMLPNPLARAAVVVAEQFADGLIPLEQLREAETS